MVKECSHCGQEKSIADFFRSKNYPADVQAGYRQPCKTCTVVDRRQYNAEWRKTAGKDSTLISRKQNYRKNAPARTAYQRVLRWKQRYGISPSDYDYLLKRQHGRCALCLAQPPQDRRYGVTQKLAVDHYHGHHDSPTQACPACIRGLLCCLCNRAVLPQLERFEWMQSDFVKTYLQSRPLANAAAALAADSASEIFK